MKFTVHTESLKHLKEALKSQAAGIRFGAEFCEWKIQSLEALREASTSVKDSGKTFTYVIPILSNTGVKKVRDHLTYLRDQDDLEVIIGDIGALNMLHEYNGLHLRLGRPRVYMPGRSPWDQITRLPNPSFLTRRKVERIFYQTSLNYGRALDYYKGLGVKGADVDWIPKSFPFFKKIIKNGFRLAVHTHAVPVSVTMRCHMARFIGEEEPALCSKPCINSALNIDQKELEKSFVLNGNVVFRPIQSQNRDVKTLRKMGVEEMIIPMGPVSKLTTAEEVNEAITRLSNGV
jgi:hypothetical protein